MNFCKRIGSIFLTVLLLISCVPTQVMAESTDKASSKAQTQAVGYSLSEALRNKTILKSPQEQGVLSVSEASILDNKATVTYCAFGPSLVTVELLDEDSEDAVLASGSLAVEGTGEAAQAEIEISAGDVEELPEFFILRAYVELKNESGETVEKSDLFYNTEYTRKSNGIALLGMEYFVYLPADHKWEVGEGFMVYASTAVVISASESEELECTQEGTTVRIAPAPTEIRNMSAEERSAVTAIVFAVGDVEDHRIIRIAPGTMEVFGGGEYLTVEIAPDPVQGSTGGGQGEELNGVYDSVHLVASPSGYTEDIPVDEEQGSGVIKATLSGKARYNWDFYVVYWDEELFYEMKYVMDYHLELEQTTDYAPSTLNDSNLYDKLNENCLDIEIPEPLLVKMDFSDYFASLASVDVPSYLHFKAAANDNVTVSGLLTTEFKLNMYSDMLTIHSADAGMETTSDIAQADADSEGTVFWVCNTVETYVSAKSSGTTMLLELDGESGDCARVFRNDIDFENVFDDKGEIVKYGMVHYCGTAPMPNNYCVSISNKPYYKYDYQARLGIGLRGKGSGDTWSDGKIKYKYISKAYDEEKTVTDPINPFDMCEHYGYQVHVTVYDKSGKLAEGAKVTATGHEVRPGREEPFINGVTDSNGETDIYVPSESWNIKATYEDGTLIGTAQADARGHATSVVINGDCSYIEKAKILIDPPKNTGEDLPGSFDALGFATEPDYFALDAGLSKWKDRYGTETDKAVTGPQFAEVELAIRSSMTAGRRAFAEDLAVDVFNSDGKVMSNCNVVYVNVSEDGQTARVMLRVDTYPEGVKRYFMKVDKGWGTGEYISGEPVLIASYDCALDYEDLEFAVRMYLKNTTPDPVDNADFLTEIIKKSIPEGWEQKLSRWDEHTGKMQFPDNYEAQESGKYSLSTFNMADQDLYQEAVYVPEIDHFTVGFPVPDDEGITLPQKKNGITLWTDLEADLSCDDSEWLDMEGETIKESVYGDQFLTIMVTASDEVGNPLKFAEELDISLMDGGSENNKKFRVVGYCVSEDRLSADVVILVHISRPGATEYELTVNYGFLSGWYEEGTLVPIVSYDIPGLKDKLEEYLGKWAIVLKEIIPPSWQKSFSEWKVDTPSDGSIKYKDDFIPIVTKGGTSYAIAFFRMPGKDAEITAVYEGLKEIKEVEMKFDLPKPGEYLDYIADSETNGIKTAIPYVDKLGVFPMMWSSLTRADYNSSYTAFIPISPKSGYKFGWPLGLTTKAYVPSASGTGRTEADFFAAVGDYALITHTYKTPKAQLLEVTNPQPVYFENGTPSSEINEYMKSVEAGIISEKGYGSAKVKWNEVSDTSAGETGRFIYDSSLEYRQDVVDTRDGSYSLKGTVILPSDIRNEEDGSHDIVDQTVEVRVIIKAKEENEIYPPLAMPWSGTYSEDLSVVLINDSKNPEGTVIWYRNAKGEATRYLSPIILAKKDRSITYKIVTWATHDGLSSPEVTYVYTIDPDHLYNVRVYGGTIFNAPDENCNEANFKAGSEVIIGAAPGNAYEKFDHWIFNYTTEIETDQGYTFEMPDQDVIAIAVYTPKTDDELIIDSVSLHMAFPTEGVKLPDKVGNNYFWYDKYSGDAKKYVTADPQPAVTWNVEGYPEAVGGMTYTAAIPLKIEDLLLDDSLPQNVYFSEGLTANVGEKTAKVVVDSSHKYATAFVSFDIPKESFTVTYDANGGEKAPEPQIKERGKALTITADVPEREGYNFLGWSSLKEGGVEYEPQDKYEKDEDAILYAVWDKREVIKKVQVAFDVPVEDGDILPTGTQVKVSVLDPSGAPLSMKDAGWEDDFGLTIYTAQTGDQYLTVKIRENDPKYSLAEKLEAVVKDTSAGGNEKVTVESVNVSDDGREAEIVIQVHISKPGAKEYYVTVDEGIGGGYYEEGDTVFILSYDIKSISTVLKELLPEYKTIISLAEHFAEKLTGTFQRWEVLDPTDGTLVYKTDFWPIILKSGKLPTTTYAAAFFSMPAHDVEVKAIYGSPKTIDSVTMDFEVPKIGEKPASLATCVDPEEGVKPVVLMGKDGKYKITWSGPDKVGYNKEYTARVYVTADSGYKLKEFLDIVTVDSYFPKGYDFDNGTQPEGYSEGSTLGFMDYAILSYTYKTPKAQLLSITQPNTVYFANGTAPEEINEYLKELEIAIMTEDGQKSAKANWGEVIDTSKGADGRYTYDSSLSARQEVLDADTGTYKVAGTLKLPGDIRNTETKMHEKVDQTVEITVVILEKDSTELLPPTADPDSCESDKELEVELIDNENNPEGTKLFYTLTEDGIKGEETEYTDKIVLRQNDKDTQYVIEAWAENGEDVSETAAFTYLVKAAETEKYLVTVIGGNIEMDGGQTQEDEFEAGTEVKIKAAPNVKYEEFDHWEFEGLPGTSEDPEYTFEMPENDVKATAVFTPLSEDGVLVESAEIILDKPEAGKELAKIVNKSTCRDDKDDLLTSQPEPAITWNAEENEKAQEGKTYTASVIVDVNDLRKDGEKLPDSAVLSGAFTAMVNGREARVHVDESRKFAVVEIDFEIPVTSFTVTYDANGGDETTVPDPQTKEKGKPLTLSSEIPERTGYGFIGWSEDADAATAQYDPGDEYEEDADIVLYAVWKPVYTVMAVASEGGNATPKTQEVVEGDMAQIRFVPLIQPTTAWVLEKVVIYDTDPSDGTDVTDQMEGNVLKLRNIQKDTNVYAFFKSCPHAVVAEIKEGEGTVSPEYAGAATGDTVDLTITPDEGYELERVIKWVWENGTRSEEDVTSEVTDGTLTIENITQNTYVDIYFSELEFTVSYDANGGTDAPEAQIKKYYSDLTLSDKVPVRDGYEFDGWSSDSEATEAEYAPESLYTENEDVCLYAVWIQLHTVKASVREGKGTVTPESASVRHEADATIKIQPDNKWEILKVEAWFGTEEEPVDITSQVKNGEISFEKVSSDIRVEVDFKVAEDIETGDTNNLYLWGIICVLSLLSLGLSFVIKKKLSE